MGATLITGALSGALSFFRGLSLMAWVAIALGIGFLYERHEATAWKNDYKLLEAKGSTQRIKDLEAAAAVTADRLNATEKERDDANARLAIRAADAASSAAASGRLSRQLADLRRQLATPASDSSAAEQLAAARASAGLLADLLERRGAADRERSAFAELAFSAALGCQRQYQALKPSADGMGIKTR